MSKEQFDRIEQQLGSVRSDMNRRLDDLGRHMHVLHEDVIARIEAIPEHMGATKTEVAELREATARRLDPLEATVRRHTVEIKSLKQDRS